MCEGIPKSVDASKDGDAERRKAGRQSGSVMQYNASCPADELEKDDDLDL